MTEQGTPQNGELRVAEAFQPDPFRCEIRESAKGEVSVSTRATHTDSDTAVAIAVAMFKEAHEQLGLS
jgi:hypothetical protein